MTQPLPFSIDADDPRSPTREQWDQMTAEQRRQVVDALPCDVPLDLFMPEGDRHRKAKNHAIGALDGFFRRIGRRVYLSSELNVYYPGEPRFAPDVLAVIDVEPHEREKWVVLDEGKGLDFVLEIHVSGSFVKDYEGNRKRYARLGIPEYFLFDRTRGSLFGWRLASPEARTYEPILPQHGLFPSRVLGLDLGLEGDRLRFYYGMAPVPEADELIARLDEIVAQFVRRAQEAEQERDQERLERERAEQGRERAEQERDQERLERERVERRVAELEAELARLRGGGKA
jgi:Uma2 family endonuclease